MSLPKSLEELPAVEKIDVRNNDLRSLPLRLSRVVSDHASLLHYSRNPDSH